MSRAYAGTILAGIAAAVVLSAASGGWAQEALSVKVQASGAIRVVSGDAELATIELNAHGLQWKHVPQTDATATVGDLPNQPGKRVVGSLPIPNTDGGAVQFTETIKPLPQGLVLEYDLAVSKAMKLNGLQVSISLPVARYAGKEALVARPDDEPLGVGFPQEQQAQAFSLWSGEGSRIEIAKGTPDAITVELRAATDVTIQDLRRWEVPVFEVRFPAIMEDGGRDVAADDRFHLDLTINLPAPVKVEGP